MGALMILSLPVNGGKQGQRSVNENRLVYDEHDLIEYVSGFQVSYFVGRTNSLWWYANAKSYKSGRGSPVFTDENGQNHRF